MLQWYAIADTGTPLDVKWFRWQVAHNYRL
jgi:hypothetical protein